MLKKQHYVYLLFLTLLLGGCKKEKSPLDGLRVVTEKDKVHDYLGKKLPNHSLKSLDNRELLLSDFEGKPTVINCWFVSCAPCIDEMPILNDLKSQYGDQVNFLSLTFDTAEKVEKLLKKHAFDFYHLVGAQEFLQEIGVQGYPKNIFIGADGIIKRIEGGVPYEKIDGKLVRGDGKAFYDYVEELIKL
ncbi:TlpA family protein disulfide reductase [Roseivirga misakiensis]|uniref:Thioredoxin domain-containing protein n=1 Tax=Roseivirga misakiensis TaxID=1563681 RepID=A0A1E5T0I3_9BACT|nr:TlpA disulfide reductase family protein [Roseivirga misakiensis]OEK04817.1 hypothetical protein BFP71_15365 [Roseivirga misakiensis]